MKSSKRVLFYRRLINRDAGSNGGNLKLRDSFNHVGASSNWTPHIYFDPATIWYEIEGNHWHDLKEKSLVNWEIKAGDLLFFSGHDWQSLSEKDRCQPPVPIINIVQPRHTRKEDKRRDFLRYPAIRIAKSENGAKILRKHGVNGPLFVVPDTIDFNLLPSIPAQKDIDIFIPGLKQPAFAQRLYDRLQEWNESEALNLHIHLQLPPKLPTRHDFLKLVARAKVIACIPLDEARGAEGFYLPALEAMALKTLVVCPHAIGNLEHCLDGINCIVPEFTVDGLYDGVKKMFALDPEHQLTLLMAGTKMAEKHRIENERTAIIELLDQAYDLWEQKELFLPCSSRNSNWIARMRSFFQT